MLALFLSVHNQHNTKSKTESDFSLQESCAWLDDTQKGFTKVRPAWTRDSNEINQNPK